MTASGVQELNTEEKIKSVARKVFLEKGFAGTKIRDIADQAEINIALLNYYFRSKEKLFLVILKESLVELLSGTFQIFSDKNLSFEEKIHRVVDNDIQALQKNPLLASFVFSEIVHQHPEEIIKIFPKVLDLESLHIVEQYKEGIASGRFRNIPYRNFFGSIRAMVMQPFLEKPIHCLIHHPDKCLENSEEIFDEYLQTQKKLIIEMALSYLIIK